MTPKLNKALSQLQGELPRIAKTKTARITSQSANYEYSYADLGDVVADVSPLLAKYGLAFHCGPTINPADRREMILAWSLLHESGEEKAGEWPLGPVNQKPQSLGSAITYGRRYCFTAATNIVLEDDDDGQRAQQDHGQRQSAADAFENAAPRRQPRVAADEPARSGSWYDDAIARAVGFTTEAAGQALWRESAAAARDGHCTPGQNTHIQNLITARIADRRKEASDRILALLGEADEWRAKVEGLADGEEARTALEELQELAGTVDETRAGQIRSAIVARFPKSAVRDLKAPAKAADEAA